MDATLTTVHPASGFAAELTAAGVVVEVVLGLPVSARTFLSAPSSASARKPSTNWGLMNRSCHAGHHVAFGGDPRPESMSQRYARFSD